MLALLAYVAMWGLVVYMGVLIGQGRGQGLAGGVLAFFLGPLGWLIAAFLPRSAKADAAHRAEVDRIMRREQQVAAWKSERAMTHPRRSA